MRTIVLFTLVAINLASLSACSTISPARLEEPYRTSDCSALEEYPDCQGSGHRVAYNALTRVTPG